MISFIPVRSQVCLYFSFYKTGKFPTEPDKIRLFDIHRGDKEVLKKAAKLQNGGMLSSIFILIALEVSRHSLSLPTTEPVTKDSLQSCLFPIGNLADFGLQL